MKLHLLIAFLFAMTYCLQENEESITNIIFADDIATQDQETTAIDGSSVLIEQAGTFHVTGESNKGNIVIASSSVTLILENLKLSSQKTAPIVVNNGFTNVEIINIGKTELIDFEDKKTTEGECAVIKIKYNSEVHIQNNGTLKLSGTCKNIIKGGNRTSIIFKKSTGKYIIYAHKTAIDSNGYLEFNGGSFDIESTNGDAIRSLPGDDEPESLGKILINDGTFNIHCFNDAFSAKNNITIVNGKFDIITEEGAESDTYNETESAKGFKLTNNVTGCEIKIYSGEFNLNTADDAFRSNRDMTILGGKFTIRSKDDGICAKFNLVLGKKNAPSEDLDIQILSSFEAIEGMTITIYSGKIVGHSKDDCINTSGLVRKQNPTYDRNYTNWNWNWNWTIPGRNRSRNDSWTIPGRNRSRNDSWIIPGRNRSRNDSSTTPERNRSRNDSSTTSERNRSRNDSSTIPGRNSSNSRNGNRSGGSNRHGTPPNDSCIIRIYDGEIYLYSDSDGIDSNGHIYIHGGNINIFSKEKGTDSPIDHNGNFTLFNAEVLGVGIGGAEYVHKGIKKGNEMYGYYKGFVPKNSTLEIQDENEYVVKNVNITKDISYIFYSSLKLNENYHFYIIDDKTNNITELEITFGWPDEGLDDEDKTYVAEKEDKQKEEVENKEDNKGSQETSQKNNSKYLKITLLSTFIILVLF